MKYDSMRKLERNTRLINYAKIARQLGHSWKEIGQEFSITGSRAWRIVNKGGKQG